MKRYEYIRLAFDWGDLSEMNALSSAGWRVIAVESQAPYNSLNLMPTTHWALMEREIADTK